MRIPASFLLVLVLMLCGCETLRPLLEGMEKPGVRVIGADFDGLTTKSLGLRLDVEVTNPYAVALPLTRMAYSLESPGKADGAVLTGGLDEPGIVPAKGAKRLSVPVAIEFASLLTALRDVRPGAIVPYKLNGEFLFDPPLGAEPVPLRFSHGGELPVPAPPDIRVADIEWKSLSLTDVTGALRMEVGNPNSFAVKLSELSYGLKLNGQSIASGLVEEAAKGGLSFDAGGSKTVEVPLKLRPADLGLAAVRMLRDRDASYDLSGAFRIETPFGPIGETYKRAGTTAMKAN
ncbi:MAG: LEA type 2 family protein [Candidatus Sumerlaeia bacterium]|nr:LEA type 2 family protein [Candidatus Sumerlaeia bacterium]